MALCLACGCATKYYTLPSGPMATPVASGAMTVVNNNTRYRLNVTVDSVLLYTNLTPGQAVPVRGSAWVHRTPVVVTGYDEQGRYVGASDWLFSNGQAEVWRVDQLNLPH
jgi:hypothetical protein